MHGERRHAFRLRQADVRPGVAAVGGLVDAIADRDRVPHPRLARAHPDRLRVGRVEGDGADRLHRLLVEHRPEGRPTVERAPHAAARRAHEDDRLAVLAGARGNRRDAAAHRGGADVADVESGDDARVEARGAGWRVSAAR